MKKQKTIFLLPLIFIAALVAGCAPLPFSPPLHNAAHRGDIEAVRKLIDQGADVNEKKDSGWDPLSHAIFEGHKAVAELLIAKGADVNGKIFSAAAWGKKTMVELLIAKGVDPRIANKSGETPRMIAEKKGFTDIAQLLKKAEEEAPRVEASAVNHQEEANFEKEARMYRLAANKPSLPEEARKFKVQAEVAVRDKKFEVAAELYGKALDISPWWPEGHFNRAIVLGESRYYLGAIREMKRYLIIVPNAPDARAAQDKIYEWELKTGK